MKKICIILLMAALLAGCRNTETLETVSDILDTPVVASMQQILVQLPQELSAPALHSEQTGSLYICDDYSVTVQTELAGDLRKTIQNATGMEKENLQIIKTRQDDADRYQWTWTANSDNGIQIGRGCILDDGNYHYVLTALAGEKEAKKAQPAWNEMFASFRLVSWNEKINTDS